MRTVPMAGYSTGLTRLARGSIILVPLSLSCRRLGISHNPERASYAKEP